MARYRAIIDFDVAAIISEPAFENAKLIISNEISNMLHKLVRPEKLQHNLILFATATYKVENNRYLFTQNDPEATDDS